MTLHLRHLGVDDLIDSAGGDPWELNRTIQAGAPGEISGLAASFRAASNCTQETTDEFLAAKVRFESAWDRHDGGDHPINDSEEVRRATESMNYNRDKMANVAVDLQNIAASLAEAQRSGAISTTDLEAALQRIDNQIDYELSLAAANGETVDVSELRQAAVDRIAAALGEVQTVRDAYSHQLDESRAQMAAEGYSPDATAGGWRRRRAQECTSTGRRWQVRSQPARGRRSVGELTRTMDSGKAICRGTPTRLRDDQRSDGEHR